MASASNAFLVVVTVSVPGGDGSPDLAQVEYVGGFTEGFEAEAYAQKRNAEPHTVAAVAPLISPGN